MVEAMRDPGFGRRALEATLVFGWIVGVGLRVLLWVAAGALLGLGLLVSCGLWAMPHASDFYRLSAYAAAMALVAQIAPLPRRRREP